MLLKIVLSCFHFCSLHAQQLSQWRSCTVDGARAVFPLSAQLRSTTSHLRSEISFSRTCNILNLILVYIYRIALSTLETLHCLCVCVIAQLHALSAQQNKHLLSVEFS